MLRPSRDPCRQCGQAVFLAERLMVTSARHLYHRTCFRCARCNSQLTLANYYETEDGRFCCETCPDEEKAPAASPAPLATAPAPLATAALAAAPLAAPLATEDESTSSSEATSRRPSVTVDTNDLPSNDACERVHSLETEDYAKDQSLSLVQIRRKLFEKADSGKRVSGAQMSTNKDEQPKTDEEKLSEAESKYPAKFAVQVASDLSLQVEETSSQDRSSEVTDTAKSTEVKDTISEDVSSKSIEMKDTISEDVSPKSIDVNTISEDVSSKSIEMKDTISEDVSPKSIDVNTISEDVSSKSIEMKDTISEDVSPKSIDVKDTMSEDVSPEPIEVKDTVSEEVTSKSTEVGDESFKAVDVEKEPLDSRIGLEDEEPESREIDVEPSKTREDVLESQEDEPSESKERVDEPSTSEKEMGPQEDDLSEPKRDSVAGEKTIVEEEEPTETRASSESLLQSDDEKLSKSEKHGESDVGVDEEESRKEDDAEEKNDREKEEKTVVPPRPPPPAIQKPPVSPRKISLEVSPRKTLPVVAPRAKSPVRTESYPAELNPFSEDEEEEAEQSVSKDDSKEVSKDESKDTSNPFGSEEEEEDEEEVTLRKKERPPRPSKPPQRPHTHLGASPSPSPKRGELPTSTPVDRRRLIPAPPNLNPFWDDGEEPEDDEEDYKMQTTPQKPPVPKPRTVLSLAPDASPFSDRSNLSRSSGRFGSANSLSSMVSSASTMRRKKHAAPPPPVSSANASANSSASFSPRAPGLSPSAVSVPSSPTLSSGRSTLGRSRKSRPAPKPPGPGPAASNRSTWNPGTHYQPPNEVPPSTPKSALADNWQEGKFNKDEMNRSKQNQLSACYAADLREDPAEEPAEDASFASFHSGDKSSHGQWKRKKGPAPPRPIPQRRQIRAIPLKELKRELDDIEVLQLELERQGVNLETTIRRKFDEIPDASESSMTPDIEDLVLQLFELVNEKNELFRKQAELMYLRRQQRLEEEHADLEYQIRVLMEQPERNKTDSDKAKEEKLIQRLVEVVERRNEIVECLEMDRLREAEEDISIHSRLELFASKSLALNDAYMNDLYKSTPALTCCARKEKKKKKDKTKKGTLKLHKKEKRVDADKDIDETEVEQTSKEKKTKRKWF